MWPFRRKVQLTPLQQAQAYVDSVFPAPYTACLIPDQAKSHNSHLCPAVKPSSAWIPNHDCTTRTFYLAYPYRLTQTYRPVSETYGILIFANEITDYAEQAVLYAAGAPPVEQKDVADQLIALTQLTLALADQYPHVEEEGTPTLRKSFNERGNILANGVLSLKLQLKSWRYQAACVPYGGDEGITELANQIAAATELANELTKFRNEYLTHRQAVSTSG